MFCSKWRRFMHCLYKREREREREREASNDAVLNDIVLLLSLDAHKQGKKKFSSPTTPLSLSLILSCIVCAFKVFNWNRILLFVRRICYPLAPLPYTFTAPSKNMVLWFDLFSSSSIVSTFSSEKSKSNCS